MTRDEIVAGVRDCVATALDIDVGTVHEDDKVAEDLGADSIDLLDLVFQLEQRFGIKISPRGIERRAKEQLGETPLEIDGVYTPEALAQLRRELPEIPESELAPGLEMTRLPRLFRVTTFVNLVGRLMEEQHG
jgi:acyl carrier protein